MNRENRRDVLLLLLFLWVGVSFSQKIENVVLVTYDGLRWQEVFQGADKMLMHEKRGGVKDLATLKQLFWRKTARARREALLPFFWKVIAEQGQLYGNVKKKSQVLVTNVHKFSYPGYQEILAGYPDNRINSNAKIPNKNKTVLEWLNSKRRFRGKVAAFGSWDVFPYILNRERSGFFINAGWEPIAGQALSPAEQLLNRLMLNSHHHWGGVRDDVFTFSAAVAYLKRKKPRVLYIGFGETDEWGHAGRYDLYLQAAHQVDSYLQLLWKALQKMPQYRGKTALVMTTDHGRGYRFNAWRHHGVFMPGSERVWIAVMGPGIPALGELEGVAATQSQVAATVALLLGEDYLGEVPKAASPLDRVFPLKMKRKAG